MQGLSQDLSILSFGQVISFKNNSFLDWKMEKNCELLFFY